MNEFYVYGLLDPRIKENYKYLLNDREIFFEYKCIFIAIQ